MKALEQWRQMTLAADTRERLERLLAAERDCVLDADTRDELLASFMDTLTEAQLTVFARMVSELTRPVH